MYEKATKMRDTINELRDLCVAEISKEMCAGNCDVDLDTIKAIQLTCKIVTMYGNLIVAQAEMIGEMNRKIDDLQSKLSGRETEIH